MGLIARLIDTLRRLLGIPRQPDAYSQPERAVGYRCQICGTPVETADGPCPLCRSSDIKPRDRPVEALNEGGLVGRQAEEVTIDEDAGPTVNEVLENGDILATYDEFWEAAGSSGYQISLPDGGTERVSTKDALREALFRHYGFPTADAPSSERETENP